MHLKVLLLSASITSVHSNYRERSLPLLLTQDVLSPSVLNPLQIYYWVSSFPANTHPPPPPCFFFLTNTSYQVFQSLQKWDLQNPVAEALGWDYGGLGLSFRSHSHFSKPFLYKIRITTYIFICKMLWDLCMKRAKRQAWIIYESCRTGDGFYFWS